MDNVFPLHNGLTVCLYEWPNCFSVVSLTASRELICLTCTRDKKLSTREFISLCNGT